MNGKKLIQTAQRYMILESAQQTCTVLEFYVLDEDGHSPPNALAAVEIWVNAYPELSVAFSMPSNGGRDAYHAQALADILQRVGPMMHRLREEGVEAIQRRYEARLERMRQYQAGVEARSIRTLTSE